MSITTLINLLQKSKSEKANIFLLNMEYARTNNHLEEALVEELIGQVLAYVDTTLDGEDLFKDIIESFGKAISKNKDKYLFNRKQSPSCKVVSSISDDLVLRHLVNFEEKNESGEPINYSLAIPKTQFYHVGRMSNAPEKYVRPNIKFGNPFTDFFWFTDSKTIAKIKKDTKDPVNDSLCHKFANSVRDQLGLVDKKRNTLLIEFTIPSQSLNTDFLATPTFIEAREHRRFKAITDKNYNDDFGRTADLQKVLYFKEESDSLDGLWELVSRLVPFTTHTGCNFEPVGFTSTHPENGKTEDEADAHFSKVLEIKNKNNKLS